jgi:N-acetylglucosaminyl-diphospho-decaprenol L-rhamnosyltransferase
VIDLSVIVVSYESAPFLDACLDSLDRHLSGLAYEVAVVDNASADASAGLVARRARVALIANRVNRGFAAAVNQGLTATTGRVVMWLNPDSVLLDAGALALVRTLDEEPEVGVIGPRILDPDGGLQRSARAFPSYDWAVGHRHSLLTRLLPNNPYSRRYLLGDLDMSSPQDVDWVSGACLLHRRALVDEIGGLDERFFMYCEDVDFCLRAKRAGRAVRYDPRMRVRHQVAGSTRLRPRRMLYERHRSLWRYYRKHFPRRLLVDPVAWAAIWGRCGLVVAGDATRGLWGRRG